MRRSSCQIERVLDEATTIESLGDGREVVYLLSSIQYHSKIDTNQRRRECSEASLLYQSGIPRSRSKLPKDGKDSYHIINCLQKDPSLFPSTPHHCHNGLTHKKNDEQDRRGRTIHLMGN